MKYADLIMLARAISAQHNVNVIVEGNGALTRHDSGKATIVLPDDAVKDPALVRGYLDHEVGHVRFTHPWPQELDALTHQVWNIFEDEYVERRMGAIFPGAAINLKALEERVFDTQHLQECLLNPPPYIAYLLYKRRGLNGADQLLALLPEDERPALEAAASVRTNSTEENLAAAREYVALIPLAAQQCVPPPAAQSVARRALNKMSGQPVDAEVRETCSLQAMLDKQTEPAPRPVEIDKLLLAQLDRVLPPVLQSMRYKPAQTGRSGRRLSARHLARVAVGDDRVFRTPARRLDKAVEIGLLLDYSSSMHRVYKDMERIAGAMVKMLERIPKTRVFVWGFYGLSGAQPLYRNGILYGMHPQGGTPLDIGMGRALSSFELRMNQRSILFTITDGVPDSESEVLSMNDVYDTLGIERYGIGLNAGEYITRFFTHYVRVNDINTELAPAMLAMLRRAMA